jgi:subtilisin family serine protease
MRKIALVLVPIIFLSMLVLAAPIPRTACAATPKSLPYNVTPVKEEFAEASSEEVIGSPMEDPTPWWVDIVNADYDANGGDGIYVAVLDTGLVANWQFFFPQAKIKWEWGRGWSYFVTWNPGINDFDWTPDPNRGFITNAVGSGHGTHVTSTIVGYRFATATADMWIQGVAPKVTIIPVLGLDYWWVPCPDPNYPGYHNGYVLFGGGDDWMLTSAIYYLTDLAESENIKLVISNSWGGDEPSPALEAAINYAISKGVIIVFAAGNYGEAQMDWPGAYPQVISAAAGGWTEGWITRPPPAPSRWWLNDVTEKLNTVDYWGNNWQMFLEDFSGRPNKALGQTWKDLDVCAPGAAVVGPYDPAITWNAAQQQWVNSPLSYYYLWGTSMATPHVSGIAANIWNHYPDFKQTAMEWVLKNGAGRIPMASDGAYALDSVPWLFYWNDHDYGSGWLTMDKASAAAWIYVRGTGGFCKGHPA